MISFVGGGGEREKTNERFRRFSSFVKFEFEFSRETFSSREFREFAFVYRNASTKYERE